MLSTLKRTLRQIDPLRRTYDTAKRLYGRLAHPERTAKIAGLEATFETADPVHLQRVEGLMGERQQLETFLDELEACDVVWDVGAHIGMYTVFAARKLQTLGGRAVAFEPDMETRLLLRRNCRYNDLDNVEFQACALSNETGEETLRRSRMSGAATLDDDHAIGYERETETVPLRRGDRLVEDRVPRPTVVKMDIEGAEAAALEGMSDVLSTCRIVLVEVHTGWSSDEQSISDAVREILESHDFEIAEIGARGDQHHWLARRR
jgi:FkbM family methyltransferase